MTFADIRSRLAGLEGPVFWRSLDELAETPEFHDYLHREFPAQASEFNDPAGRRTFLKLMGASLALAGVSACTRQPEEKIIPYVRQPEEIVPGRPLFFATSMPQGGFSMPLLGESHEGRPTKVEGNPEHPASLGSTDMFSQASILGMYDPDRSHSVINASEIKTWAPFVAAMQGAMITQKALGGRGLRVLTEPVTSPSLTAEIQALLKTCPDAKWHQWDPVYGTVQGGAPAAAALYRFDKADVITSLDADFLGFGAGSVRYAKDFASRRKIDTPQDAMNRLYMVEPAMTVTGVKADHRLPLQAREVHGFTAALATAVGVGGVQAATLSSDDARTKWIPAIAADLHAHHGRSVVVPGEHQPAAVHALARAMNEALGNVGQTVTYSAALTTSPADGVASLGELVGEMYAGKVDLLLILGGNPVFTAPADLNFSAALEKVATRVHLGLYHDETAEQCHWHIPEAHYLESWGDGRAFDGTVTLTQPLIAPMYDGKSAVEIIALLNGKSQSSFDLLKGFWTSAYADAKSGWVFKSSDGQPFASVDSFWRHAVHDGFIAGTSAMNGAAVAPAPAAIVTPPPTPLTPGGMEIVFRHDPTILDGRYANNGWLQELPKPISKVTWDNVAYVSVRTAESMGIATTRPSNSDQDVIEISYQGRTLRMPVWVMPGTAENTVVVHFGYGRTKVGRVGNNIGVNVYPIRTSKAPWFDGGASIKKTGDSYLICSTQNHFVMEGRNPLRVVDAAAYRADPKGSVAALGAETPPDSLSMYKPYAYNGYKWGMAIDLNSCNGCSVCIAACVSENNIAVVGKEQVKKTREMHWIRVDTYYEGDLDQPKIYQQPVPCQQCEDAPCESVCPVGATVHSDEGLNDMVYNRCVGTRYCSNNCPYKVRRFNFLLYQDWNTPEFNMMRNPDVTVRSRGVMEKCTYCVQRISHARIDAKTENRQIREGDIKTACQQACPSDAIVFGNLNDADSKVAKLKAQDRNYGLFEGLGTRPRTSYLAVVRNPNPVLESK